ncbi:histidine phosphatase family protein [Streptomyces johnsoniae]|uniref:Histidine phosphatase family protein n=1 Tax=Streptomyces johnsoniae TaxID=3075532 RepID=A0ABU2RZQ8_9ACTN|nr:histidine phosphatase family protein [Streptomyces sp. DSM 41886]MDT0442228.1 histidine phosphatase family protein [Streptomyces sp. DSM 41886]
MTGRLLLVRHAETEWHRDNRYAGARSDPDLTAHGLRQVDALAKGVLAERVEAVASSPLRRALRTATPAADALGVPVDVVPDLREADFGALEGRTRAEADPGLVRRFLADPVAHPFPGAEPPRDAAARTAAALRDISARHAGRTVLVVGHSTALRLALCALLGLPLAAYRQVFPRLDNVAATEIRLPAEPGGPMSLLSLNRPFPPSRKEVPCDDSSPSPRPRCSP